MSTADIITSYEKHLEANWTREGVRRGSTFGLEWKSVLPHVWMQDQLTAKNIEEIYSKPLPSHALDEWKSGVRYFGEALSECEPIASAKKTLS